MVDVVGWLIWLMLLLLSSLKLKLQKMERENEQLKKIINQLGNENV